MIGAKDFVMGILTSYPQDKLVDELKSCGVREDNINKIIEKIYGERRNDNEYDNESRNDGN